MSTEPMRLGVCYYPEHWPEMRWAEDAARMAEIGLSRVRIGEFAWSRIEPEPGQFDWAWLDRAIATLHAAGLGIILGTPTATPPKWLVDRMPEMLAVDRAGRVRGYGSRRHYCFAHLGYRAESARITRAIAERYGAHPAIVGWQTDNEYGCHDTAVSYSAAARDGFRRWCSDRYGSIAALNSAWGNVFWSMEARSFDEIELPNLTVTEANPAHWLAFRRFSSDQVVAFNRVQTDILREASPGRDIIHNFMGFYTQFDHHDVSRDLDMVSWDSYPLGFLEQFWFSSDDKARYARQGHPDIAAFHHDLYRGCARNGRWAVMEQQPGPVNWARYNPAPLPGMVRLWTIEAMAHGAELVSYFRWRQAPFAQEQMHAGLLRPDSVEAPGAEEARQAAADIAAIGAVGPAPKCVALLFDYPGDWVTEIQPQGAGYRALKQAFAWYSSLRQLGLNIDILPANAALDGYQMVVAPCLPMIDDALVDRLSACTAPVILGPRSGSKTAELSIPDDLPPGLLQRLIPIKVARVESLAPGQSGSALWDDWIEHVESSLIPEIAEHGHGLVWRHGSVHYVSATPTPALLQRLFAAAAAEAGIATTDLPEGVRLRRAGNLVFAFNYASEPRSIVAFPSKDTDAGTITLPAAGFDLWRPLENNGQ
jgi:beta-galactosidase